jgi:transcriptional regulator of acetoin/glycerol metabolism
MNTLMLYDFPGNVRELENIIEHGFVLCRGSIIQNNHLPPELIQATKGQQNDSSTLSTPITKSIDEQEKIISALRNFHGNIARTSEELGIHRTTLWRKIKRYNIDIKEI